MIYTATYSPDDNKLRLYASSRLDADLYQRVKAAGFAWAPKQQLFVAPMWTPGREDLLLELAGEIGDEDKTLTERAEERADRFEDYKEKRTDDAERARAAVSSIADNIPFGQPILIGHHSERHARRDAERIENGMRKAVKAWETAEYWKHRAAGAIAHAAHKERPDVRARRIKTIEADKRKQEKYAADAEKWLKLWNSPGLTLKQAQIFAGACRLTVTFKNADGTANDNGGWSAYDVLQPDGERYQRCPAKTLAEVVEAANSAYPRTIAHCARWIAHYENRLTYERAMLEDAGGLVSDRHKFEIGGRVLRRGSWYTITRVNPGSVSVAGHFAATITHDEIKDYQAPTPEQAAAVAKAAALPPLCNYPGEGFRHMTRAELDAEKCRKWSDFRKIGYIKATETTGAHRVQQVIKAGEPFYGKTEFVYITDAKRKDPPALTTGPAPVSIKPERAEQPARQAKAPDQAGEAFAALKETLRAGVQVVTAPQLFPTPPELAARMVQYAGIEPGAQVLEPSGGSGAIIRAIKDAAGADVDLVAVEIKPQLADVIRTAYRTPTHCKDFLQCNGELGKFDRVLMNPPFANAQDIAHIQHARKFLKPGGRLVAICANGPRQRAALQPIASHWEDLPPGSFKESGTGVNAALLVIEA